MVTELFSLSVTAETLRAKIDSKSAFSKERGHQFGPKFKVQWVVPTFKLAVIVYRALHGTAPSYLSEQLRYIADMPARTRLRSSSTSLLDVRPSRRVTVGDRSFATAGRRIWNTLPRDVTTATSLLSFRRKLKTHLFRQSYLDIVV